MMCTTPIRLFRAMRQIRTHERVSIRAHGGGSACHALRFEFVLERIFGTVKSVYVCAGFVRHPR